MKPTDIPYIAQLEPSNLSSFWETVTGCDLFIAHRVTDKTWFSHGEDGHKFYTSWQDAAIASLNRLALRYPEHALRLYVLKALIEQAKPSNDN